MYAERYQDRTARVIKWAAVQRKVLGKTLKMYGSSTDEMISPLIFQQGSNTTY